MSPIPLVVRYTLVLKVAVILAVVAHVLVFVDVGLLATARRTACAILSRVAMALGVAIVLVPALYAAHGIYRIRKVVGHIPNLILVDGLNAICQALLLGTVPVLASLLLYYSVQEVRRIR